LTKPTIDHVCVAFHVFQQEVMQAMTRYRPMSDEQTAAFSRARNTLRVRLMQLGLAEHIEWGAHPEPPLPEPIVTEEGWGYLLQSRKWHYFGTDGRSLCGRYLMLNCTLETGNDNSPDNCPPCVKALNKRRQK
jgi:hypothetical protein